MHERVIIVLPGGNPTAIASRRSYDADPARFGELLQLTGCEQAGSIRISDSTVLLRMMGWEFSINGLISAALAFQRFEDIRVATCKVACDLGTGTIWATAETSWEGPDTAMVRLTIDNFWARVHDGVAPRAVSTVFMEGINHFIAESDTPLLVPESAARRMVTGQESESPASTALLHTDLLSPVVDLVPFVHVPRTRTFVRETSCGSGAVAIGMLAHARLAAERLLIRQPSGQTVDVQLARPSPDKDRWTITYITRAQVLADTTF